MHNDWDSAKLLLYNFEYFYVKMWCVKYWLGLIYEVLASHWGGGMMLWAGTLEDGGSP